MKIDCGQGKFKSVSPWKLFPGPKSQDVNKDLDIDTKRAALKASPAVVSLVSYEGGKKMFAASGTIIGSEKVNGTYTSTVVTSSTLLRSSSESNAIQDDIKVKVYLFDGRLFEGCVSGYDFHFNIATINMTSDEALPVATLRPVDDSISIYPSEVTCPKDNEGASKSFQLHRHSNLFKLRPGDHVVAIGRTCGKTHELMAAPGKFRKPRRPWLGLALTNLCTASIGKQEKVLVKLNISKGLLVGKVMKGSPAEQAGILHGDVIVQCGQKDVQSFLEFFDIIWKMVGKTVEVVVVRESSAAPLILKVFVDETSPDKLNRKGAVMKLLIEFDIGDVNLVLLLGSCLFLGYLARRSENGTCFWICHNQYITYFEWFWWWRRLRWSVNIGAGFRRANHP
ncbi:hypothetical protein Vadar_020685 [Vaccinium darrowii]|uniref:Uncharacterized protein n=1 Tax=Vaccinium darrowii TaxID=229202 RepID=A0ACB7ZLG6_9ERIC|nr:hypothetical protein Vadar_020685 [Vaccinium darrowii]